MNLVNDLLMNIFFVELPTNLMHDNNCDFSDEPHLPIHGFSSDAFPFNIWSFASGSKWFCEFKLRSLNSLLTVRWWWVLPFVLEFRSFSLRFLNGLWRAKRSLLRFDERSIGLFKMCVTFQKQISDDRLTKMIGVPGAFDGSVCHREKCMDSTHFVCDSSFSNIFTSFNVTSYRLMIPFSKPIASNNFSASIKLIDFILALVSGSKAVNNSMVGVPGSFRRILKICTKNSEKIANHTKQCENDIHVDTYGNISITGTNSNFSIIETRTNDRISSCIAIGQFMRCHIQNLQQKKQKNK